MDNDSLKLIARLQTGAARLGQSIDVLRFAADAEYAKTAILRFTDLTDERGVALALELIERLGIGGTPAPSAAAASVSPASAAPRGPMFRRELRPPARPAPAPVAAHAHGAAPYRPVLPR
jgi:hypothetical protein